MWYKTSVLQAQTSDESAAARKDAIVRSMIALRTRMTSVQARVEVLMPPELQQEEEEPKVQNATMASSTPASPAAQAVSRQPASKAAGPQDISSTAHGVQHTAQRQPEQQPAKRQRLGDAPAEPLPGSVSPDRGQPQVSSLPAQPAASSQPQQKLLDDVFGSSDDEPEPLVPHSVQPGKGVLDPSIKQKLLDQVRGLRASCMVWLQVSACQVPGSRCQFMCRRLPCPKDLTWHTGTLAKLAHW